MASDRIATVSGTFLRPVVSKNNRQYTTENIAKAVSRMQDKISSGATISMYTKHAEADHDNALSTIGRVTKVQQMADGSATFEADIANTTAGRDIAGLVTPKQPYLKGVSIRGNWVGDLKTVEANGKTVTTADDLDIAGIDFTGRPGVEGAEIHAGQLLESAPDPRLVFESLDEVQFTEETVEDEPGNRLSEAVEALQGVVDALSEGGDAPGDGSKPYGSVKYADSGYQADKKKRYPIDTAAHVRAAWAYINKGKNASAYSSAQLARIKGRIKAAAKKFGINITEETEQFASDIADLLEAYACMSIDNGEGSVSVSGYTNDPEKLNPLAHRIAYSAIAALYALDPDEDGDVDLIMPDGSMDSSSSKMSKESTGNGTQSPDDDMESASVCTCGTKLAEGVTVCPTCGEPVPQAESTPNKDTEAQVADATQTQTAPATNESGSESPLTAEAIAAAVVTALAAVEAAKAAPAATEAAAAPAVEATPAAPAAVVPAAAPATTSTPEAAAPVTYTTEQVAEMVKKAATEAAQAALTEARQEAQGQIRAAGTTPVRKGLVTEAGTEVDEDDVEGQARALSHMNRESFNAYAGDAWLANPTVADLNRRVQQRAGNPVA